PFPSLTTIPPFFNLSSITAAPTATWTTLFNSTRNGTSTSFTSWTTGETSSVDYTWLSPTPGAPAPTGVPGSPTSSSTASSTPTSTSSSTVPLVPAIVGSLGGVALLAALGVLLLTFRRRRRPTSTLLAPGWEGSQGPFMTEAGFTVLSGQRLDDGTSGGT